MQDNPRIPTTLASETKHDVLELVPLEIPEWSRLSGGTGIGLFRRSRFCRMRVLQVNNMTMEPTWNFGKEHLLPQ
jgi:hypothetical protein